MPATLEELRNKEESLRALLAQAKRLSSNRGGSADIEARRARDLKRKNDALIAAKALRIPKPKDPVRREQLEADAYEWLRFYLADVFTTPFQAHHREMIEAIERATVYASDQAIAGPRGEGKSSVAEAVILRNILKGVVKFAVLFAATGNDARNSLASIKGYIATSDRLLEDYPEVCIPVRDAEATPSRAHSCVVYGDDFPFTRAHFQWSGEEIILPRVPGSRCAGSIIATRGLDAAVRGLKKFTSRPELAVIDDPDTENTANSEEQAAKLIRRIDRAIAGLARAGQAHGPRHADHVAEPDMRVGHLLRPAEETELERPPVPVFADAAGKHGAVGGILLAAGRGPAERRPVRPRCPQVLSRAPRRDGPRRGRVQPVFIRRPGAGGRDAATSVGVATLLGLGCRPGPRFGALRVAERPA